LISRIACPKRRATYPEVCEENERTIAIPDLPGVMAYGDNEEVAVHEAKSIAVQVLADMVESGDELP
jgi:predicted RNase H-like HicB family nuclease